MTVNNFVTSFEYLRRKMEMLEQKVILKMKLNIHLMKIIV